MDNRQIFDDLVRRGIIKICVNDLIYSDPKPINNKSIIDRIEGMLLGVAIGDALANTTEGLLPEVRNKKYGEITDYIHTEGYPSDDTQLTFWTLEQILSDNGIVPENLAQRYYQNSIIGIGSTIRQFRDNYKNNKIWYHCGPESAGNGALMRITPAVVLYLKPDISKSNLWIDTAILTMITHNDFLAIASSISFVNLLWNVLDIKSSPESDWWLEKYLYCFSEFHLSRHYSPRGGKFVNYNEPVGEYISHVIKYAYEKNLSTLDACNSWYSGAYLLETLPSVLYILMKHGANFEEAIIRAVNDTKDNDTIASIVGGVCGALHGRSKIPDRWINNLLGRTTMTDDGQVFYLIDKTKTFVNG